MIVLRYLQDLTEAQTADALGCSVGTVKSQTSRALAKLRAEHADIPAQPGNANPNRPHQEAREQVAQ